MRRRYPHRWMRPDTHYTLIRREDGDQYDAPTGEVMCDVCHETALHVEHIDHEPWCRQREHIDELPSPRLPSGWLRPAVPERPGHDLRFVSCLISARTRALNPADYLEMDPEFQPEDALDFFGQVMRRAEQFERWEDAHDYNDMDWRVDELHPEELNAGRPSPGSRRDRRGRVAADGGKHDT